MTDHLKTEILTYLGDTPKLLKKQGNHAAGQVALNIGNLLLWIHSEVEPPHQSYQPLHETPVSIYALGKQFREVALSLIQKPEARANDNLHEQWEDFLGRFEQIKTLVARSGGAK